MKNLLKNCLPTGTAVRRSVFGSLLAFSLFSAGAQTAADAMAAYLPASADVVITFNAARIGDKFGLEALNKMGFMLEIDKQAERQQGEKYNLVSQLYKNPTAVGISRTANSYMFLDADDKSGGWIGYVFAVEDRAKFEEFLSQAKPAGLEVVRTKNYSYYSVQKDLAIVWKDGCAIIAVPLPGSPENRPAYPAYDDPDYTAKSEAWNEADKKEKAKLLDQAVGKAGDMNPAAASLLTNLSFKEHTLVPNDVSLWSSGEGVASFLQNLISQNPSFKLQMGPASALNFNTGMTKGSFQHVAMNFEPGGVKIESKQIMAPEMAKLMKGVYRKGLDKELTHYVKEDNLMGFVSTAVDIKKMFNMVLETYKPMLEAEPTFGPPAKAALDMAALFIDEDRLCDVFSGDMLFALTDFKEYESTFTTYEYDADYNRVEVVKTKKEKMPEFVALAKIKDKKDVSMIVDALEKFKLLSKNAGGKSYVFTNPKGGKLPVDVYMAIADDCFIITNDAELVDKKLKKGWKKKQRIGKALTEMVSENAAVAYLDLTNMMKMASAETPEGNGRNAALLKIMQDSFSEITAVGSEISGDTAKGTVTLTMKDPAANGLEQMFKIIDKIYWESLKK